MSTTLWYVYILQCGGGRLYTGITTDPARRLKEHKSGKGGRFTRSFGARKLLYAEEQPSRSLALRREAEIKRWPRSRKLALIATHKRALEIKKH